MMKFMCIWRWCTVLLLYYCTVLLFYCVVVKCNEIGGREILEFNGDKGWQGFRLNGSQRSKVLLLRLNLWFLINRNWGLSFSLFGVIIGFYGFSGLLVYSFLCFSVPWKLEIGIKVECEWVTIYCF